MKTAIVKAVEMAAKFATEAEGTKYFTSTNGRDMINELLGGADAARLMQDMQTVRAHPFLYDKHSTEAGT